MAILPSEIIRNQLLIFGVEHELPLALQSSELDFGFVPHLQHMLDSNARVASPSQQRWQWLSCLKETPG